MKWRVGSGKGRGRGRGGRGRSGIRGGGVGIGAELCIFSTYKMMPMVWAAVQKKG